MAVVAAPPMSRHLTRHSAPTLALLLMLSAPRLCSAFSAGPPVATRARAASSSHPHTPLPANSKLHWRNAVVIPHAHLNGMVSSKHTGTLVRKLTIPLKRTRSVVAQEKTGSTDVLSSNNMSTTATTQGEASPQAAGVVAEQLRLFWRLAKPYFTQAEGAKLQAAILLALVLLNSGVSVLFSYTSRDFWTALSSKNSEQFYELTLRFAAALAVATPITVIYRYQRLQLAISWREWMTKKVCDQYYANQSYYKLELDPSIDNPDQRVAEDVRAFTRVSLDFFITLLTSAIDLVSFSSILYSIYPNLFFAIFAYAGLGSLGTVKLGQPLGKLNAQQLQREADFRYSLVRVRDNAESIAFYQGEAQEQTLSTKRLTDAISNLRELITAQRNLEFFTTGYRYLIQILPVLVVAPLYFAGSIELGVVSQSSSAFNHVLNDLSILINEFESVASFSAGLTRLSTFITKMEEGTSGGSAFNLTMRSDGIGHGDAESEMSPSAHSAHSAYAVSDAGFVPSHFEPFIGKVISVERGAISHHLPAQNDATSTAEHDGPSTATAAATLSLNNLTLTTPDGTRQLFSNVTKRVERSQHLLILGPSGTGKSSLLRAVAGLWDRGAGTIERPPLDRLLFIPQRPYCTIGSLREQLYYPSIPPTTATVTATADKAHSTDMHTLLDARAEDARLVKALETVRLEGLLSRLAEEEEGGEPLDAVRDWGGMLSLGEQQRLCFARILVNRPELAILDEATSALDLENEKRMYEALAEIEGLTYISVGHRPSLHDYHCDTLVLQ